MITYCLIRQKSFAVQKIMVCAVMLGITLMGCREIVRKPVTKIPGQTLGEQPGLCLICPFNESLHACEGAVNPFSACGNVRIVKLDGDPWRGCSF